ncbi:phosphatidate cytidylyltransferase [Aquicoccus sp. G2-2]|uniref:phosphatidate cytidylyltransferase n=1 Tax=Aquicoccus sp. G2-2 TaxID=3092120 RepID=UPI003670A1A9
MTGQWGDLGPRLASAAVMIVVGAGALWWGGAAFGALATVIVAAMTWELVTMVRPTLKRAALQEAGVAAIGFVLALFFPHVSLVLALGVAMVLAGRTGRHLGVVAGYGFGIFLGGLGLYWLREGSGLHWALWLVGVVVISDVAGYFAGRLIGGPKFWPAVSPKKTWSGTVAGWVGAAVLSAWMAAQFGLPWSIVVAGVLLSFAAQLGDVAESAIKRKMKVKDSSSLIPGHGGVMDRFDGMIGAGGVVALWQLVQASL